MAENLIKQVTGTKFILGAVAVVVGMAVFVLFIQDAKWFTDAKSKVKK